jgi:cell division protein FtsQ
LRRTTTTRRVKTKAVPRRRRRKRHFIDRWRVALCLASIALLVVIVATLFNSPQFMIRKVVIRGNNLMPARQIARDLAFANGSNIFTIKGKVIARTLTRNPIVASVHIHRKLPRTLIVEVTERRPHFTLNTGTALYEIDRGGIPYRMVKIADPKVSMIACAVSQRIILGTPLKSPTVSAARECLLLVQSKRIFSAVKITVDQTGYLCLNVGDKFQVKMGRPEGFSEKLDVVQRVLKQIPDLVERGGYIDVTSPGGEAFKYADKTAP